MLRNSIYPRFFRESVKYDAGGEAGMPKSSPLESNEQPLRVIRRSFRTYIRYKGHRS